MRNSSSHCALNIIHTKELKFYYVFINDAVRIKVTAWYMFGVWRKYIMVDLVLHLYHKLRISLKIIRFEGEVHCNSYLRRNVAVMFCISTFWNDGRWKIWGNA